MATCNVCIEKYTRITHKKCVCNFCQYEVCRVCLQQYLLTIEEDAHCMNCKKKWSREQVDEYVSKAFRNGQLKKRREELLYEKEKALLPASQSEVQRVKEVQRMRDLKKELELNRIEVAARYRELSNLIYTTNRSIYRLENGTADEVFKKEKRVFTIHCPNKDCRGYVNNTEWTCGTCMQKTCKKCHELMSDENHECKPENIETAQLLAKETRPCPGCSTLIYKISGCLQMWCTQCHTAFNWETGQVEKGVVHNPHFYEWQQQHGGPARRTEGDIPCGGLISVYELRTELKQFKEKTTAITNVYNIHRICNHIQLIEMPNYRVNVHTDNLDLRVKYLMNEITEEQFKIDLQKKEKKLSKKKEIYDVLEMYIFTMVDLFRNLLDENITLDKIDDWIIQVEKLQSFANTQFQKISNRYNNVAPYISLSEFNLIHYN